MKAKSRNSKLILLGLIIFGGVFGLAISSFAETINVASCSSLDIQEAIDISIGGDTIMVPAGNCVWESNLLIPDAKKLTILGAGIGNTLITSSGSGSAVELNRSASRISGFDFTLVSTSSGVNARGPGWRVDHCRFSGSGLTSGISTSVQVSSDPHPDGLVDQCIFHNARVVVIGGLLMANKSWSDPIALGTAEAVYVEDCQFDYDVYANAIDSNYGGKYVFRYNTVTDASIDCHSLQSTSRATRKWEIYNNTVNQVNRGMWVPIFLRGGTGVIFNNTITGTFTLYRIVFNNRRSCETLGDGGLCDGNSPWDGNQTGQNGYPCRDQIGWSTDTWEWTDENPYPPQTQEPAYLWNNKHGEEDVSVYVHNGIEGCTKNNDDIVANRDFYDGVEKPGYTPYTYPHPLRNESDITAPSVPSGLSVN